MSENLIIWVAVFVAGWVVGWMTNAVAFERWLSSKVQKDETVNVGGESYHLRKE